MNIAARVSAHIAAYALWLAGVLLLLVWLPVSWLTYALRWGTYSLLDAAGSCMDVADGIRKPKE